MNPTPYDILRELAPTDPVDAAGLEVARASVETQLLGERVDGGPEIPSSEWPGLIEHGWTLPDVPVTFSPTLQTARAECAGQIAAAVFADPEGDRAVAVYEQMPSARTPDPDTSLSEADVVRGGPSNALFVTWTGEDGHPWWATGEGVSIEQFRAILRSLAYGEHGAVTGPVPDGFKQVKAPETRPGTTLHLWTMWHSLGLPYLRASWPVAAPIEAGIADGRDHTAVEFDGGVALYSPGLPDAVGNPPSLTWEKGGVRF